MAQVYAAGVRPEWWKLPPPQDAAGWRAIATSSAPTTLIAAACCCSAWRPAKNACAQAFEAAAGQPLCKGFAVGRSIFADAAAAWFAGTLDDAGVIADVATRYQRLIALWCAIAPRRHVAITTPRRHDA